MGPLRKSLQALQESELDKFDMHAPGNTGSCCTCSAFSDWTQILNSSYVSFYSNFHRLNEFQGLFPFGKHSNVAENLNSF